MCNPSTWEPKAGRIQGKGYPGLQNEIASHIHSHAYTHGHTTGPSHFLHKMEKSTILSHKIFVRVNLGKSSGHIIKGIS